MAIKTSPLASTNHVVAAKGTVLEIDTNNVALVVLSTGQHVRVRADMLRGKSAAPQAGETWIFDQPYGIGWMFAVPMNYTGGDQDFTVPTFTNGWGSKGGSYQPVGYKLDSGGYVVCQGRLTGGTGAQAAFALPLGYRPGGQIPFVVCVGTGTGLITVAGNGVVTPAGTGDTSLEQVRFLAEF